MNAAAGTPIDVVTLEMAGALEEWKSFPDGSIHILLRLPVHCRVCGMEHSWYVNREGRTRCAECDARAEQMKRNDAARAKTCRDMRAEGAS